MVHCIEGSQVIISKKNLFLPLAIDFVLANSADPDEIHIMRHFIWVFTYCQITHLGVSCLQKAKRKKLI